MGRIPPGDIWRKQTGRKGSTTQDRTRDRTAQETDGTQNIEGEANNNKHETEHEARQHRTEQNTTRDKTTQDNDTRRREVFDGLGCGCWKW